MRIATLIIGILGVLLGVLLIAGYFILPELFNGMSYDEATIMLILGIPILILSGLIALLGLILTLTKKKAAPMQ